MSLNRIITEAVEAHDAGGIINRHQAINDAVPRILADPDMTEACVRADASRRISNNVKARIRERADAGPGQRSIFGLRDAYVVSEGEGDIKETRLLKRLEFQSVLKVREDQMVADKAQLDRLRHATVETAPIWDAHPDWTWGQVEDAYARLKRAAA